LALTSAQLAEVMAIVHSAADRPEIVGSAQLAVTTWALRDLLLALAAKISDW
jgi:hypothetical protein